RKQRLVEADQHEPFHEPTRSADWTRWTPRSRIVLKPFNNCGGLHAPLRILLPGMQETLRQNSVSGGLRRRRGALPILRQQESRAALVGLLRYHLQKERVTPLTRRHLCASTNSRTAHSRSTAPPMTTMS